VRWLVLLLSVLLCASPLAAQSLNLPPPPAADAPEPAPGYVVLDAGSITVEHVPNSAGTAKRLKRLFDQAQLDVEDALGLELPRRPHVVVAFSDDEFVRRHRLATGHDPASDSVLAIAMPERNLVIVRESGIVEGSNSGLDATFRHELAHLALGTLERQRGAYLPRWLNEGLAEFAAGRRPTDEEQAALSSWAKFGQMPELAQLSRSFPRHGQAGARAYLVSAAFVAWLHYQTPVPRLTQALARAETDQAFVALYRMTSADAETEWKMSLSEGQSTIKSLVYSMNTWSFMALLAIVAGLRAYWQRRQLSLQIAAEEAAQAERLRTLWANTFARMEEDPGAPVYCPECRQSFLEPDAHGIGCPACGARPVE